MPHVTFIHGILNKPPPDVLLRAWQRALADGTGLDLGAEGVTAAMVYWADVLYEAPEEERPEESLEAATVPEQVDAGAPLDFPMSPKEEVIVAKLAAKFQAVEAGLAGGPVPPVPAGAPEFERVPLPWFVKRRVLEAYLRDVHHYLFNVESSPRPGATYRVQDEIRRRTVQALRQGTARPGPMSLSATAWAR